MPSRKHIKPPPTFSFVTLEFEAKETRWLKIHSGAVRSHSAYWGGPARHRRQAKKHTAEQLGIRNELNEIDSGFMFHFIKYNRIHELVHETQGFIGGGVVVRNRLMELSVLPLY